MPEKLSREHRENYIDIQIAFVVVVWKIYFYEVINKPPTSFANFEVPSRKNVFTVCRNVDLSYIIRGA